MEIVLQAVRPRNRKTSEVIARALAGEIVDKQLTEGTRLPNEKDMLQTLGVGRATLREALRLLETRGVLDIRTGPTGGPLVRLPRPSELSDALTLMLMFEKASLSDVLETLQAIEPSLARLAVARMTAPQLRALEAFIEQDGGAAKGAAAVIEQSRRFHSLIADATGNSVLRILIDTLNAIVDGSVFGIEYTPKQLAATAECNVEIVAGLRARDADRVEAAIRRNLDGLVAYWEKKYRDLVHRPIRWL